MRPFHGNGFGETHLHALVDRLLGQPLGQRRTAGQLGGVVHDCLLEAVRWFQPVDDSPFGSGYRIDGLGGRVELDSRPGLGTTTALLVPLTAAVQRVLLVGIGADTVAIPITKVERAVEVEPGVTSGDYLFGFLEGTRRALSDGGRLSVTLTLPRVDARSLGALIALFERAVGLYATLINVNAYHQPGVEAGKRAAAEYLKLQQRLRAAVSQLSGPLTLAELADQLGTEEVEAVYKILRHLAATGRDVQLQGDPSELAQLQVSAADR